MDPKCPHELAQKVSWKKDNYYEMGVYAAWHDDTHHNVKNNHFYSMLWTNLSTDQCIATCCKKCVLIFCATNQDNYNLYYM